MAYLKCIVLIAITLSVVAGDGTNSRSFLDVLRGSQGGGSNNNVDGPQPTSMGAFNLSAAHNGHQNYRKPYLAAVQRSASDPGPFRPANHNNYRHRQSQRNDGNCHTNYQFDYIQLTLQWGPGFCKTSPQACQRVVSQFTIHGMWLNTHYSEGPSFCCFDNVFNFKDLASILPDLDNYWFSYYNSNNRGFWSHEWLKHGTCARDVPALRGEKNYFGTTIDIFKKMPILDTLKKANIVPSNSKIYISTEFNSALKQISQGKDIQVDCDYEHDQKIPILKGVNFCFDSSLRFVDCPPMKKRCRSQVYFLSS